MLVLVCNLSVIALIVILDTDNIISAGHFTSQLSLGRNDRLMSCLTN